jgi:hypothetical protein
MGLRDVEVATFLDSQLIYMCVWVGGEEVVSLTCRSPFTLRKIPGTHLMERISRSQGRNAVGRIRSTEMSSVQDGNRIRDLPAFITVPQPITLQHALHSAHASALK